MGKEDLSVLNDEHNRPGNVLTRQLKRHQARKECFDIGCGHFVSSLRLQGSGSDGRGFSFLGRLSGFRPLCRDTPQISGPQAKQQQG